MIEMRYSLFVKDNEKSRLLEEKILTRLNKDKAFVRDEENPEVVILVGGDGTFLQQVQKRMENIEEVTFISFNGGKLGFYSEFLEEDIDDLPDILLGKKYVTIKMPLLKLTIEGKEMFALNEFCLSNKFKNIGYEVYVDDRRLESYVGAGLIVASPTGSMAYNRSLMGPIIDTSMESFVLTECAGVNSKVYSSLRNSLVLQKGRVLTFKPVDGKGGIINYDSSLFGEAGEEEFTIELSSRYMRAFSKENDILLPRLEKTIGL